MDIDKEVVKDFAGPLRSVEERSDDEVEDYLDEH